MWRHTLQVTFLVLLTPIMVTAQTPIDSTWDGTTGTWVTSNGWDALGGSDPYPDNNASFSYNATLPPGLYSLSTLGASDLDLLSLQVGANARLTLDGSALNPGVLTNDGIVDLNTGVLDLNTNAVNGGVIRFDASRGDTEAIIVRTSLSLTGDGRVVFRDNDPTLDDPTSAELVVSNGFTLTQSAAHVIEGGPGRVRPDGNGISTLVTAGVVRANVPLRTIRLDSATGTLAVTNSGTLVAEDLGTLQMTGVSLVHTGDLVADSATLDFDAVTISGAGSLMLFNGGVVEFDGLTIAAFAVVDNQGGVIPSTGAGLTAIDYTGTGVLTVDSTMTVDTTLTLEAGAVFTVGNASTVGIGDAFVNELTDEFDFDFGSNGTLRFTSATGASPLDFDLFGSLETAGEDLGDVPVGFLGNFAIPNLVIAAGAKVGLVDLRDNGNRGGVGGTAEALYVDTLTFADSNGILNLNGLHLYVTTLVGNPLQIKDAQAATPATWVCGSDNWNTTACWDQLAGTDPHPDNSASFEYTVTLPPRGSAYDVSMNISGIELNSLDADADATLNVLSTFTPGAVTNTGTIENQSSTTTLDMPVMNDGVIRYDTDSSVEYFNINGNVALSGTGTFQFQNPSASTSSGRDRLLLLDGTSLTNGSGHTMEGGYALVARNSGTVAFINDGAVRSNTGRFIEFETTGGAGTFAITNNDLMVAEASGDLTFDGIDLVNNGTVFADGSGSIVTFFSDTTLDNTLGTFRADNGGTLSINATIAEASDFGTFAATNGIVNFGGDIDDTGTWLVDASYGDFGIQSGADLANITIATAGGQTFALRSTMSMTDVAIATNALVENQSSTATLSGRITNDGVLQYDTDSSVESILISGNTDFVSLAATGILRFQNPSASTSSGRDRLTLLSGAVMTNSSGHRIEGGYALVARSSGNVAFINDGEVRSNTGRFIEFETTGGAGTFAITNNNLLVGEANGDLTFDGIDLVNNGTVFADGSGSIVTFLSDTTLDNTLGILRADNGGTLSINAPIAETSDFGTFAATNGIVDFSGDIDDIGTWLVDASYGDFGIQSGADLANITIATAGGQTFALRGTMSMTDVTVSAGSLVENQSSTATLRGTITNDGTVRYDTDSSVESYLIDGNVNLSGSGTFQFQNPSASTSSGRDRLTLLDTAILTNDVGHTIEGGYAWIRLNSGTVAFVNDGEVRSNNNRFIEFETTGGVGTFALTNNNLLAAEAGGDFIFDGVDVVNNAELLVDGASSTVTVQSDATLDNSAGTLRAVNGGSFSIQATMPAASAFGTVDAAGGVFTFSGTLNDPGATWTTGSHYGDFSIGSGADITGIAFASSDAHLVKLNGSSDYTDVTIDPSATLEITSGTQTLRGSFTNNGLLRYDTDSSVERILIADNVTLGGTGTMLFQNPFSSTSSARDRLLISDGFTLINGPDHLMLARGYAWIQRNSGTVAFVNQGEVRCDVDRFIVFDALTTPASNFAITNDGSMMASSNGEVQFEDVTVTNNGVLHADGSNSRIRFQAASVLDNTAGELRATDGGIIQLDSLVDVATIASLGTISATNGFVLLSPKFNQPGATWVIDAAYGDLTFQSSTALTGITISSPDNHIIKVNSSTSQFTDMINDGAVIETTSNLNFFGTLVNNGVIRTDTDSSSETIALDGDFVLAGTGVLKFQNPWFSTPDRLTLTGDVTVTNAATHTIEGGYLRIERVSGDPMFVNDGLIRSFVSGDVVSTYNPSGNFTNYTFINNNQVTAENGGDFNVNDVTWTNNGTMTADGAGSDIVFSSTARLDNATGLLEARNGGRVLFSSLTTTLAGDLSAFDGGEIELANSTATTTRTITIDGGTLDMNNATLLGSADLLLSSNGLADFDANSAATLDDIFNDASTLTVGDTTVSAASYGGNGVLTVNGALAISGDVVIDAGSDVLVGTDDEIDLGGNYDLKMIFDINYAYGNTGSSLRMTGGTAAAPDEFGAFATLEGAGQDLDENDDPTQGSAAGFVQNFSIEELVIGPGAKVRLVDNRDNAHRGGMDLLGTEPEALYVDTLTFEDAAGLLALNGVRIYYNSTNAPGQVVIGTDCNSNGVADTTDITGATSADCNDNAIPDECEIDGNSTAPGGPFFCTANCAPDCNSNGIPDECDLADCTMGDPTCDDCNTNGIPDACDLDAVTSFDINGNNIPDECENDCNNNGVPDATDIAAGTSQDCNNNSTPDECEPGGAVSLWIGPDGGLFSQGFNWSPAGVPDASIVLSNAGALDNTCVLSDAGTTPVCDVFIEATGSALQFLEISSVSSLSTTDGATIAAGGVLDMMGGTLLGAAVANTGGSIVGYGLVSADVVNQSSIVGSPDGVLRFAGASFANQSSGTILAPAASIIVVDSANVTQAGFIDIRANATVVADVALVNSPNARIDLVGGSIDADALTNDPLATISGFGIIESSLTNDGDVIVIADMQIAVNLINDGVITIQSGTLTVAGSVSGGGEIIGAFSGRSAGDGFTVIGDHALGAGATFEMSTGEVRLGGDFDNAMTDFSQFDLRSATLQFVGLPEQGEQWMEASAPDMGRDVALPDASLWSIDRLRVGPTATTVRVVDDHDNSAGAGAEAIYVNVLQLDPGTTLDLNGHSVYFNTVIPANPFNPASGVTVVDTAGGGNLLFIGVQQLGDFDDDGDVDLGDLAELTVCLQGPAGGVDPGCDIFDFDASITIDLLDFAAFQNAFTGDRYN